MATARSAPSSASSSVSATIDYASVSIVLTKPLRGFSHAYYPIYLNQNTEQTPLAVDYRVSAARTPGGAVAAIAPSAHDLRIVPILRYGITGTAIPEPQRRSDAQPRRALDIISHTSIGASEANLSLRFRISTDILSTGGFESTARLRLLVLHPTEDVVLAFVDSHRFAIMTREFPTTSRLVTYLREWGFAIHPDDQETNEFWGDKAEQVVSKKRKVLAPEAFAVDDEQEADPFVVSMPDGRSLFTLKGRNAMRGTAATAPAAPATAKK